MFKLSTPKNVLRCVCGAEVRDVNDLSIYLGPNAVYKARCKNSFCKLEEVLHIVLSDKTVEAIFSPMFSDYNLLTMGSDVLEKELEALAENVIKTVIGGKSLKTRVKHR